MSRQVPRWEGAFLAPLFEHLPQATLAAIVIVAIAGFFDVAGVRRQARIRRSALVFAGLALAGVLSPSASCRG